MPWPGRGRTEADRRRQLTWLGAVLLGTCAQLARAAESCTPEPFRWREECSTLGLPWLLVGAEYRLKTEYLNAPDFGLKPGDLPYTAVGERALLHVDLRTGIGVRAFVQLAAATDAGRHPAERPFDRTRPDIAQAFVDVPLSKGVVLRVGRQELDSGGNRLIAVREAANVRLAFDMAHLAASFAGIDAVAFYGRPVLNRLGAFDDRGSPTEKLLGGWLQRRLWNDPIAPTANLFFLSRDRSRAVYEQGVASDARHTIGVRLVGSIPGWDYSTQAARQYGRFGTSAIHAFGFAGEAGWHPDLPGSPRIAASFGYASGDPRAGDRTLGTFDVLYPNLGYFTDAPVYYPGNTADVQPNVSFAVGSFLTLRVGADVILRVSKRDAVYGPPGIPVLLGNGTGPAYVTTLSYLRTDWTLVPGITVGIAVVHGDAGTLIHSAGGHAFNYGGLTLDLRI
jgi:alginate export protein